MTILTLPPFKRLILHAVLNDVSPIVAQALSIPDDMEITARHDVFLSLLRWQHDLGFILRVHGQEFNSYQRHSCYLGDCSHKLAGQTVNMVELEEFECYRYFPLFIALNFSISEHFS